MSQVYGKHRLRTAETNQQPTSINTWRWWFKSQCMQHQLDRVVYM